MTDTTTPGTGSHRQALGRFGENRAAEHLVGQGMVVLDRNWRCEAGEIDLVLRDGRVLVVCEVKTRSSVAYGTPHEAVTGPKLARLQVLARRWQECHDVHADDVRIDLVCIVRPRTGAATLDHVRGVA